jgi:O-antigen/teichoic acid export membrane protein
LLSAFRLRSFDTSTEVGRSKERNRRTVQTTLASVLAKAAALLAGLVSVPLTFRYLGAERYGVWMVLISMIAAMSFADLGIGNGLMNAVSEAYGKDDESLAREYVTSALALMLCIAALLTVAGAVGFRFLPWLRLFNIKSSAIAAEAAIASAVLYGSFVVNIPLGVITRTQAGLQKGYASQMLTALSSLFSLGFLLVVIWFHGLAWLVFGSVFPGIAATAFNGWILFRQHPGLLPAREAFRRSAATKILGLGLMFFLLQIAYTLSFSSDNIVIAQVLGAAAVAAYAVPQKLFSIAPMLVAMGITPLWPAYGEALTRGDVEWVRKTFVRSLQYTFLITVSLGAVLTLAGPWIMRVAIGKTFNVPLSLLVTLSVWGVVNGISAVLSMLLNGAGVMKVQTIFAVISSAVNLALSIFFTRRFGLIGVCLGSIVAQLAIMVPVSLYVIRNLFLTLEAATARNRSDDATSLA